MRKTVYLKFILAYVIFGILSFIMISSYGSSLMTETARHRTSRKMYSEAVKIAQTYASDLYNTDISLEKTGCPIGYWPPIRKDWAPTTIPTQRSTTT